MEDLKTKKEVFMLLEHLFNSIEFTDDMKPKIVSWKLEDKIVCKLLEKIDKERYELQKSLYSKEGANDE